MALAIIISFSWIQGSQLKFYSIKRARIILVTFINDGSRNLLGVHSVTSTNHWSLTLHKHLHSHKHACLWVLPFTRTLAQAHTHTHPSEPTLTQAPTPFFLSYPIFIKTNTYPLEVICMFDWHDNKKYEWRDSRVIRVSRWEVWFEVSYHKEVEASMVSLF